MVLGRFFAIRALLAAMAFAVAVSCSPLSSFDKRKDLAEYDPYAPEGSKLSNKQSIKERYLKDYLDDPLDREAGLYFDEFEEEMAPLVRRQHGQDVPTSEPPIPELSDILATPRTTRVGSEKLVSLSVTDEVPLRDVLIELGRLADIDIEIDPGISGGIILRVNNKPLDQVVDRIASLSGLRYEAKNGILRIERDLPYIENYQVDFLNLTRSNSGSVNINTQVLGGGGEGGGGGGLTSGSTNAITSNYEGDVWASIELALTNILEFEREQPFSGAPSAVSDDEINAEISGEERGLSSDGTFSINRPGGVITVVATQHQHEAIENYLEKLETSVSAQVLIEAKIVEVELNKEYRTGIDWNMVDQKIGTGIDLDFSGFTEAPTRVFQLTQPDGLNAVIQMLEVFGNSRTLSSPRLHAMNNQQAVLTFAENRVYFTIEVEREVQEDSGTTTDTRLTVDSTLNTVPIGVILTLQPSINLEKQEVTLNVRPTISSITSTVADPGVDLVVAEVNAENDSEITVTSEVPVIEVKELDSVLKVKSGSVMVIGGLMEETANNEDNGVPYLGRIPIVGNLFKSQSKVTDITETVIFIKATIVPSSGEAGVHDYDKHFYKRFTRDPRPLAF